MIERSIYMNIDLNALPEQHFIYKAVFMYLYKKAHNGKQGDVQRVTNGQLECVADVIWVDVLNNLTYELLGYMLRKHIEANEELSDLLYTDDFRALRKALHAQETTSQLFPAYVAAVRHDYPALDGIEDKWFEQAYEFIIDLWLDNDADSDEDEDGNA